MIFPLKTRPKKDYKTCPRGFGCPRIEARKHAACDLYTTIGSEILAVEDGVILRPVYYFYLNTYALEIKHASGIVVRYGEIQPRTPKPWKIGDAVKAGEVIATVGQLQGLYVAMLHFELYAGTGIGPLTVIENKGFQRRSDLIDPTAFLDACVTLQPARQK